MTKILKWRPCSIPIALDSSPSLEKIYDGALQAAIGCPRTTLVDQAMSPRVERNKTPDGQIKPNNWRKTAWLGDSVLSMCASQILLKRYPQLDVGHLTITKDKLVQNITLSHLSVRLGILGKTYDLSNAGPTEACLEQCVAADAFEVYLGTLYQDAQARGDHDLVQNWLEKLWEMTVFPNFERGLEEGKVLVGYAKLRKAVQTRWDEAPPVVLINAKPKEKIEDQDDAGKTKDAVHIRWLGSAPVGLLTDVKPKKEGVDARLQEPVGPSTAATAKVKEAKEKLPADTNVITAKVPFGLLEPNPDVLAATRPGTSTAVEVKVKAKAAAESAKAILPADQVKAKVKVNAKEVAESAKAIQPTTRVKAKPSPILKVKVKVQTKAKPAPSLKAKPAAKPKPSDGGKEKPPMILGFFPTKGPSDYLGLDTAPVPQQRTFSTAGATVVRKAQSKKGEVKKKKKKVTPAPLPKPKAPNAEIIGTGPALGPEKKTKKKSKAIAN